jgi:peptide/nickel transport system permease protein
MLQPNLYFHYISNSLKQKPFAKYHLYVFCLLLGIALAAPHLAFEPQKHHILLPLIPYDAGKTNLKEKLMNPFGKQLHKSWYRRHWFGTDAMGRDIAAGIVTGTRTALQVGFGAVTVAALIGLLMGLASGYYGDNRYRMARRCVFLWAAGWAISLFYIHIFAQEEISITRFWFQSIGVIGLIFIVFKILEKIILRIKHEPVIWTLPIDYMVMRSIDLLQAIPFFIILLGITPIIKEKNIFNVILIIGCVSWMPIARLMRAQVLKLRDKVFIQNAEALGYETWRIWLLHLIPNLLTPLLVVMSFGVANAIMAEGLISFFGIGLPPAEVTWGSICQVAREEPRHWWLAIFPMVAIFITVLIFNWLGEHLKQLK